MVKIENEIYARIVKTAFDSLKKQGFLVVRGTECCQTCSWAKIEELEAEMTKKPIGYAFYHTQDAEFLNERGLLYIGWGYPKDEDESCRPVADKICKAFRDIGCVVDWDGDHGSRILIVMPDKVGRQPKFNSEKDGE